MIINAEMKLAISHGTRIKGINWRQSGMGRFT